MCNVREQGKDWSLTVSENPSVKNTGSNLNMSITNRTLIPISIVVLVSLGGIQTAQALLTSLVPLADTYMRDGTASDLNFGDDTVILAGVSKVSNRPQNRGLLEFDFADIPTNATITNVTLNTVIFRENVGPVDCHLNRVLEEWDEHQTTWNNRLDSTPWHLGGCEGGTDYVSTPSVTAEIDDGVFSSTEMIGDVQLWLNSPAMNFGWILIADGDLDGDDDSVMDRLGTGKEVNSRESGYPPTLTVEYTLSPPPAANPPLIFGAAVGNEFRFSFNAESNRVYSVDFCDSLATTNWDLLATIPAQPVNRIINVTNTISTSQRFFRARTP